MAKPDPSPSPLSVGIAWAHRCLTLGVAFTLPTLAGWALERRYGFAPWGTLVGAVLGFGLGMVEMIRLTRRIDPR